MKSWLQKTFINLLVRHLFNLVTEDDVLRMVGRTITFQGQTLSKEMVLKLAADAKTWRDSMLWQVLATEVRFKASERMFEKSMSVDDMLAGKMALYNLEVIEKKIAQLSNL